MAVGAVAAVVAVAVAVAVAVGVVLCPVAAVAVAVTAPAGETAAVAAILVNYSCTGLGWGPPVVGWALGSGLGQGLVVVGWALAVVGLLPFSAFPPALLAYPLWCSGLVAAVFLPAFLVPSAASRTPRFLARASATASACLPRYLPT